jgi:hypothetical protein
MFHKLVPSFECILLKNDEVELTLNDCECKSPSSYREEFSKLLAIRNSCMTVLAGFVKKYDISIKQMNYNLPK